jgi:hypothetical protein
MSATKVGNWFNNWHPVTIPLLLLVLKIGISLKLGPSYRFVQFPADVAYYGVTFYVWALTTKSGGIDVCPRGMGIGEWNFIIFFLILNFAVYFLSFPAATNISFLKAFLCTFLALFSGLGSPVFLRWR